MEPLLPTTQSYRAELVAQAASRAPLLKQLAARIELAGAADWVAEFHALCSAFVCGDGKDNRAVKVRMAMLAAGAEGGDRVALDVVAGIIRVPVHVVEVETAKLFSTIAQAATLQLLPALHAIKRTTQERLAPSAALCARVASEVLLMPICPTLAAEVSDMYYHPSRRAITGPVSYGQAPQEAGRIA